MTPAATSGRRWALALLLLAAGCAAPRGRTGRPPPERRVKPVVAVVDFENLSGFEGQWKLGGGMADLLVSRLLESERFTVLERKQINDILGELTMQARDLFRREGRVPRGRLKNARYLIRGSITDFTVTRDASGWFGTRSASAGIRGQRARVALTLRVVDVETGEVMSSAAAARSVSSGMLGAAVDYRKLAFGGDAFLQTPLGRATDRAMAQALRQVVRDLPVETWQARVAEGGPDEAVINGGLNVGLRAGDVFLVRAPGRTITDPTTGNVIQTLPGPVKGRLRVTEVDPLAARAMLEEGEAQRGDPLEQVPPGGRTAR